MQLVLSAPALAGPGGVQSYLLTVAPQLERLGHEVWLYAPVQGAMAELARGRGLRVARGEHELPERCDAVLAQDAPTLLEMADRYAESRRLLVVHGGELDVHLPPALDGAAHVAVALNDAVARRVRAIAAAPEIVRLTQPIDVFHFRQTEVPDRPRRVLLLGNYVEGEHRVALAAACAEAGLEYRTVGVHGGSPSADPRHALLEADIVVGIGRSVLEAMSCGRPAWIYCGTSGDGWVTRETYPAMEADGFRGRAVDEVFDADSFRRDLAAYDPEMGRHNRAAVLLHHRAEEHATALVEALLATSPTPSPSGPLREMARLIRTRYEAETRAAQFHRDVQWWRSEFDRVENEVDRRRDSMQALVETRRWRAFTAAGRMLDRVRRLSRSR